MQGTYGNGRLVTVFGGSGFVGRHLVRALAGRGYRVRAAVRRPELAVHLQPLGMVGQIHAVPVNIRHPASLRAALDGAVAVVNLVGILAEGGRQVFQALHVDGAAHLAEIAAEEGVETLVHMSALGADPGSDSVYFRTKAEGEDLVRRAFPMAAITRPSLQFGAGDSFLSRFAGMARMSPVLPIVGANTQFQMVYVGDVAEAIARAVDRTIPEGTTYEFGGPEIRTFRECMQLLLEVIQRRRLIVNLPFGLARVMGGVLQALPGHLLTTDQVRLLRHDLVVSEEARAQGRTLEGIGIHPTGMAAILPRYLSRFRPTGEYARPFDSRG